VNTVGDYSDLCSELCERAAAAMASRARGRRGGPVPPSPDHRDLLGVYAEDRFGMRWRIAPRDGGLALVDDGGAWPLRPDGLRTFVVDGGRRAGEIVRFLPETGPARALRATGYELMRRGA
jgi:hypothetical protein